jgi:putative cell wall-binding protein
VKSLKFIASFVTFLAILLLYFPTTAAAATNNTPTPNRIYGSDRFETAAKIAEAGWPGTSDSAILAPGMDSNLIDALIAGPLAAKLDAPILLTETDSLNSFAKQELSRLAVKTVYITITTGSGINLQNLITQVKAIPTISDVEVLGGNDASQTSVNIANKLASLGTKINKAIVVGGTGVDALSVSPIAGAQGIPILYSSGNSLSGCVSAYLKGLGTSLQKTYVIGGSGVISDSVLFQIPGQVERVAGEDRYATNIQVLEKFGDVLNYQRTYLANGDTVVDALSVSPLAAQSESPILLTYQTLPSPSLAYAQANLSPTLIALGGEAVVPANILSQLTAQQVMNQAGSSQGSTDPKNPSTYSSVLNISGDNITLNNAATDDSIFIQGNNDTLNNVQTKGTIFVDPGSTGAALLENVKASKIVILSGGYSIDLQNVTANSLINESSSNVYLISSNNTAINQTTSTSSGNFDNSYGGSFGPITIKTISQSAPTPSIDFTGTYTQPITVKGSASLITSTGITLPNVVVAPGNSSQSVTLQGLFSNVAINNPADLILGSNTMIQSLVNNLNETLTVQVNSKIPLTVPAASSITNINTNNQSQAYFGEDSGTSSNAFENDFYIGQLGYGTHVHFDASTGGDDAGGNYFNSEGAANATVVYGYWLLSGMSRAPKGTTAAAWGQQQAQLAVKAFNDMSNYYGLKAKPVIFIDVEACAGGLDENDDANNQVIYTAFVNWIKQNTSILPGTYSSPREWNVSTMGANFSPLTPGCYWVAGYPGGTPDQSLLTTSNPIWSNFPQTNEQAQIWQFEGTPDYDVARVLPG